MALLATPPDEAHAGENEQATEDLGHIADKLDGLDIPSPRIQHLLVLVAIEGAPAVQVLRRERQHQDGTDAEEDQKAERQHVKDTLSQANHLARLGQLAVLAAATERAYTQGMRFAHAIAGEHHAGARQVHTDLELVGDCRMWTRHKPDGDQDHHAEGRHVLPPSDPSDAQKGGVVSNIGIPQHCRIPGEEDEPRRNELERPKHFALGCLVLVDHLADRRGEVWETTFEGLAVRVFCGRRRHMNGPDEERDGETQKAADHSVDHHVCGGFPLHHLQSSHAGGTPLDVPQKARLHILVQALQGGRRRPARSARQGRRRGRRLRDVAELLGEVVVALLAINPDQHVAEENEETAHDLARKKRDLDPFDLSVRCIDQDVFAVDR
mmetsp:Transcript_77290/g.236568  ORF Transcript_77290/g.236568 Transcript_77290/m.236568 type:complete len:381 (+) Transcript_77290:439-1581(+)